MTRHHNNHDNIRPSVRYTQAVDAQAAHHFDWGTIDR